MAGTNSQFGVRYWREYGFVLILGIIALIVTSIPYVLGAGLATGDRVYGGFVYAIEDCYSYLAKMRQGAEGAWLFRIAYTPEPHRGALFFPFHLLLGKVAALLPGSDLIADGLSLPGRVYRAGGSAAVGLAIGDLRWRAGLVVGCTGTAGMVGQYAVGLYPARGLYVLGSV